MGHQIVAVGMGDVVTAIFSAMYNDEVTHDFKTEDCIKSVEEYKKLCELGGRAGLEEKEQMKKAIEKKILERFVFSISLKKLEEKSMPWAEIKRVYWEKV